VTNRLECSADTPTALFPPITASYRADFLNEARYAR